MDAQEDESRPVSSPLNSLEHYGMAIDGLPHYGLTQRGSIVSVAPGSMRGALISRDHLDALLASEETVTRLARACAQQQGWDGSDTDRVRAVLRALTGGGARR